MLINLKLLHVERWCELCDSEADLADGRTEGCANSGRLERSEFECTEVDSGRVFAKARGHVHTDFSSSSVGFKSRIDNLMAGPNQKIVDQEISRKKKEYRNNLELVQISKIYEMQKIEFKIEVGAGPSLKIAALAVAQKLSATWVILDRQMKKDKKYFLENLSCGISRMKRNDNIEKLRGPKASAIDRFLTKTKSTFSGRISYDEMVPGSLEDEYEDLFSIELFPTPTATTSSLESTASARSSFSEVISSLSNTPEDKSRKSIREMSRLAHVGSNCNEEKIPFNTSQKQKPATLISSREDDHPVACAICKNRRPMIESESRSFSYAELLDATHGFSSENLISKGVYANVFRGELKCKLNVAVKQRKDVSFLGERKLKFKSEIQALGKTRHENVVMLLGSCSEESHRLLVYESVCNGSLDQHISHQSCRTLTWGERMKIAVGTSRGLNHLHKNSIIHRDIRPKNVFLTHDFRPLLGGFGLAKTQDEAVHSSDQCVIGTFGYLAPEYAESGKATTKTDVYSFGVVLLELITGRSTTDQRLEEKSLLGWARPLLKERNFSELMDPKIANTHDSQQFMAMVQVAQKCLSKDALKRLSMDAVVSTLEHIKDEKLFIW